MITSLLLFDIFVQHSIIERFPPMIRCFSIVFLGILFQSCYGSNVISLPYITNDIEYASTRGKLYALIGALDPDFGNRIIEIDISTGTVERSHYVGTEPWLMRITSDENYAWISFQNIPFIRRINLNTFEIDKDIYLGPSKQQYPPKTIFSTILTTNFSVFPDQDNQLALSLREPFDFEFESLSLYKNDSILPVRIMGPGIQYYPFCVEPILNGKYLISHYQTNWESEYSTIKVQSNGLELRKEDVTNLNGMHTYRNWFKVMNDTLYTATGEILDATDSLGLKVIGVCENDVIGDKYGFAFSPGHDAFIYPNMTFYSLFLTFYDRQTLTAFDSVYLFDYHYNEIMLILELEVIDRTRFALLIGKDYGDFFIRIVDTKNNGIESNGSEDKIRIYPNPASDKIWVNGGPLNKKISIYDMMGNLVGTCQRSGIRAEMDLSSYTPGVYTVKIADCDHRNNKDAISKIVVQR